MRNVVIIQVSELHFRIRKKGVKGENYIDVTVAVRWTISF